jgi:hypothetical protein
MKRVVNKSLRKMAGATSTAMPVRIELQLATHRRRSDSFVRSPEAAARKIPSSR